MSALSVLRSAVERLESAEMALLELRQAYDIGESFADYCTIDAQFEVVGDAKTTIENILAREERIILEGKR